MQGNVNWMSGYYSLIELNPYKPNGISRPYISFGRIHFEFKGFWAVNFIFIQILKYYFVSKHCKTWSDAVFCKRGFFTVCRCPI